MRSTLRSRALDASGAVVPTYTGTVHFTSSDGSATLPGDYTFQSGDNGVQSFSVTLTTAGNQTVTGRRHFQWRINGSATVTVTAAAASKLAFGQQPSNAVAGRSSAQR